MNKAELKRLALEVRQEVGLGSHDRFDPNLLADLYGIQVVRLSELGCQPETLGRFHHHRPDAWSGALIRLNDGSSIIVENDFHSPERRAATMAHEMSHELLEHPFTATILNANGCRSSMPEHEDQAAELSGELLLPFEAAKRLAFYGATDEEAAQQFGVSLEFARWRLHATGARKIAARARSKHQPFSSQ